MGHRGSRAIPFIAVVAFALAVHASGCASTSNACSGGVACGDACCASGQGCCDGKTCMPAGTACCNTGQGGICPVGFTCVPNGCQKGTTSSSSGGTSTSSGGTSSSSGAPGSCTQSAHPQWEPGECTVAYTCPTCTVKTCLRVVQSTGFCCTGLDLGYVFIPCDNGCGSCTGATQAAAQDCHC